MVVSDVNFLFLTELIGLRVFDVKGRRLGRVRDAAIVPVIDPVRVDRYLVGGGWSWLTVRHDQVSSIVPRRDLFLRDELLTPYHDDEYMLRLVRDLLDQQIIDAHGRKVVRVTDLTLRDPTRRGRARRPVRASTWTSASAASLRRLAQGVVPPRWVRRLQRPIAPKSIDWERLQLRRGRPRTGGCTSTSRTTTSRQMHPADIADIVEDLGPDDREAILDVDRQRGGGRGVERGRARDAGATSSRR